MDPTIMATTMEHVLQRVLSTNTMPSRMDPGAVVTTTLTTPRCTVLLLVARTEVLGATISTREFRQVPNRTQSA